ncbi:MAG TPA: glycoside hydrolase family 6 protein [Kofleriaceae bacterium]|nr:glycoside hydrolase family 6 protein [Kofleriaceae bacterium]
MKIFTKPALGMLAVLAGIVMPSAAFAQTHVDNPYVGATVYKNPDYAAKVQTSIAQTTDSAMITKMQIVAQTPTFVWLDRMAAIPSSATQTGLQAHLDNALAQQHAGSPIVAQFVVYDMPGRDCAALASNGEIPLTADGLNTYKTQYIDVIAGIMSQAKYAGVRIVLVVEPDSLPNLVTNLNLTACANANSSGIYIQATQYALNKLHAIPNVYTYLDIGHSGWLGWPSNAGPAVTLFTNMANGTTAKLASVDGFVTDTANDIPFKEPFMTGGNQQVAGQQLISANFYQFDPDIDEASYTADLWARFTQAGWPTTLGMLTDTSRNGWGGPGRPTAASASTDVNAFVNASKIDTRPHRGLWCNQSGAGLGAPPQATPSGFPASHLDAFVWVKPPGDSDGASQLIANDEGKGFDRMCDPTFLTQYNVLSNALPNAPLSGHWFHAQFVQLITNASPAVGGTTPPPACTTAPAAPTSVTATAASANQINLTWSAVTPPTNCSVSYNVYRSTTSGFSSSAATQIASALTTTTFSDPGRNASTTYFYIVEAADGAGTAQARAQATTPTGTGPTCTTTAGAVTNLTATANSSSQISLSWSAVTPPTNCSVTYSVHRSTTANFTPSAATLLQSNLTTTSNVSTNLAASTTYFFAVTADDAAGSSTPTRAQATTPGGGGGTGTCHVGFTVTNSWPGGFQAALSIQNTGTAALNGWTLTWTFPSGQQVTQLWNGAATQTGTTVSVTNLSYNGSIAAGASYNDAGFTGSGTPATPTSFAINGVACQ